MTTEECPTESELEPFIDRELFLDMLARAGIEPKVQRRATRGAERTRVECGNGVIAEFHADGRLALFWAMP